MLMWDVKERIEKHTPTTIIQLFQLPYIHFSGIFGDKQATLLDCACGSMYQTAMLEDRFKSVLSIDKQIVKPSEHTLELDLPQVDRLPFEDNCFDVVFSFETIEHLPEDKHLSFVTELCRVGKLIIIGSISVDGPNYIQHNLIWKDATGTNPYYLKEYTSWEWVDFFSNDSLVKNCSFFYSGFSDGMLSIIPGIYPSNGFSNYVVLIKEDSE